MSELRQLPIEEWSKLEGHPALAGWVPDPTTSIVVVAEQEGEIIALWAARNFVQLEGFWVAPEHRRKSRLPVRLVNYMREVLATCGIKKALCWTGDPVVVSYLTRLGMTKMPVDSFLFETNKCLLP
jgi:N-acetylglutamate synthase-like GNAT family acetyltransferase